MTYEEFRNTLKEQKIKHYDPIKVSLFNDETGEHTTINGMINTKINPCELYISYNSSNTLENIDTDFVHRMPLNFVESINILDKEQ